MLTFAGHILYVMNLTEIGSLLRVDLVVGEGLPLCALGVLLLLDGVVQGHHLRVLPSRENIYN